MAKDQIGNELAQGDLVRLNLDGPQVIGRVMEIHEGGLLTPGNSKAQNISAGTVVIAVLPQSAPFDPRSGVCLPVIKLHNPDLPAQRDEDEQPTKADRLLQM